MTARAVRAQNRPPPNRCGRIRNRLIDVPNIASTAGASVNAQSAATAVTMAPTIPIERRNWNSNMVRAVRPMMTAVAEKAIVLPIEALVATTAARGPVRRSSRRYRETRKSE